MLGMYLTISPNANLQAAELQVLTGGGMTAPLKELGAQFETTPELIKLATSGDPFDLAVVPREVFKDAAAQSQLVAGPTTDIARWSRCCISLGRSEARH
jgi:molybdate transport system substrate-binding protein